MDHRSGCVGEWPGVATMHDVGSQELRIETTGDRRTGWRVGAVTGAVSVWDCWQYCGWEVRGRSSTESPVDLSACVPMAQGRRRGVARLQVLVKWRSAVCLSVVPGGSWCGLGISGHSASPADASTRAGSRTGVTSGRRIACGCSEATSTSVGVRIAS